MNRHADVDRPLLVLAGGFGTRLRSAVRHVPKPLAPVSDRPFLQHLTERWVAQGVRRFVFLLHHDAALIEAFLDEQQRVGTLDGCDVSVTVEPTPLGTGGAVAFAVAERALTGTFLVTNADTWLGEAIVPISAAESPAMAVVRVDNTERYGRVHVADGRVTSFEEKTATMGAGWINAGLYALDATLFANWNGAPYSLERELFPGLVEARQLHAVPVETEFIDIGIPEDYARFCRWPDADRVGAP
jgi:D-glycero-alpha-D-manno-heptose 1-phosphate guanylyltransferase